MLQLDFMLTIIDLAFAIPLLSLGLVSNVKAFVEIRRNGGAYATTALHQDAMTNKMQECLVYVVGAISYLCMSESLITRELTVVACVGAGSGTAGIVMASHYAYKKLLADAKVIGAWLRDLVRCGPSNAVEPIV